MPHPSAASATLTSTELKSRLRILLPETYQVFDTAVQPRSMGSAGLKFGPDGKVLWGEMWASFCHLAMAGGPPHRGRLLQPARLTAQDTQTPAYQAALAEIARGIGLVTGLCAEPSPIAGWLRMYCTGAAMCSWLQRAIVMENVSAVAKGLSLYLPVGPDFRVEKEIKNVITSVAKTCHYWQDHMADAQRDEIAALLASMEREAPLVPIALAPAAASPAASSPALSRIAESVAQATGLQASAALDGWLGIDCRTVPAAVWIMRTLAACNLLARREEVTVFVPVNADADPEGERTRHGLLQAFQLATEFGVAAEFQGTAQGESATADAHA